LSLSYEIVSRPLWGGCLVEVIMSFPAHVVVVLRNCHATSMWRLFGGGQYVFPCPCCRCPTKLSRDLHVAAVWWRSGGSVVLVTGHSAPKKVTTSVKMPFHGGRGIKSPLTYNADLHEKPIPWRSLGGYGGL
jgi:hypothetical protein